MLERTLEIDGPAAAPPTSDRPQHPLQGLLTALAIAAVMGVPFLVPRLPGNSVPVDGINLVFLVVGGAVLWRTRQRIRVPLGISYFLILTAGILATSQSIVPQTSAFTIVQDLYVYVWFVVLVNFLVREGSDRIMGMMTTTWAVMGTAMALFVWLVTFVPDQIPFLFGFPAVNEWGRALGTFRDPNMAGNYLVLSLFVLWASPRPRAVWLKVLLTIPFILAVYETQSITALVAVTAGTVAALSVSLVARRETAVAIALAAVGVGVVALTVVPDDFLTSPDEVQETLGEAEVFAESLGRTDTSLSVRVQRWQDTVRLFGDSIILGIGPSAADPTLRSVDAPITGELHNDYLSGFVERGLLGGIGVLMLFAVVSAWALRVAWNPALVRAGWRPAAFAGGMVVILLSAFSLETLHFRHVWLFLAVMVSLGLLAGSTQVTARSQAEGPPRPRRGDQRPRGGRGTGPSLETRHGALR